MIAPKNAAAKMLSTRQVIEGMIRAGKPNLDIAEYAKVSVSYVRQIRRYLRLKAEANKRR